MRMTLDRLSAGQSGVLCGCLLPSAGGRELERLGLVSGTEIRCVHRLGPARAAAYAFSDTVLALRDETAACLLCER